MSTMEKIKSEVERLPEGQPFTARAFMSFGSRASVDQVLSRMVKSGVLSRPARGVYVRPKHSPYVGAVPPEPIRIAELLAAETGDRIQVHGAEAVRRLGLSTQVQTKPIFYTSGPSRRFRLETMMVSMKHVSPRKIALAGRPAGLALTALWYLGKGQVTIETIEHIHSVLGPEEFEVLCAETPAMPGWMHAVILKYSGQPQHT